MIKQYRKKPVVIEAVQWTGENLDEIKEFVGDKEAVELHAPERWFSASFTIGDYIVRRSDGSLFSEKQYDFEMKYEPEENAQMNTDAVVAINNVALCLLIGFLCWLFQHWWPVFLLVFWSHKEFVDPKKEEK